jgi:hypothetical protein
MPTEILVDRYVLMQHAQRPKHTICRTQEEKPISSSYGSVDKHCCKQCLPYTPKTSRRGPGFTPLLLWPDFCSSADLALASASPFLARLYFRRFGRGSTSPILPGYNFAPFLWPWRYATSGPGCTSAASGLALLSLCPARLNLLSRHPTTCPRPRQILVAFASCGCAILAPQLTSCLPPAARCCPHPLFCGLASVAFLRPASTLPFFPKSAKTKKNGKG